MVNKPLIRPYFCGGGTVGGGGLTSHNCNFKEISSPTEQVLNQTGESLKTCDWIPWTSGD